MRKSKQEMLEDILLRLEGQGGITETSPGSIARMFSEVIVEELDPIYAELDLVSSMSFISTTSDAYLDLIGELLNCKRNTEEVDDEYRARISNQVTLTQSGNLTAIRLSALQIEGVADVQFKRFTRGTGSFTCYVVPQVYPIEDDLLTRVEREIQEQMSYGINADVKVSDYTPVDITINLIFHSKVTQLERDHIRYEAVSNVEEYMKQMNMGTKVVMAEIIQTVMDASEQILDMEIKELVVNDKQYFIKNIEPSNEQRYFLRKINMN